MIKFVNKLLQVFYARFRNTANVPAVIEFCANPAEQAIVHLLCWLVYSERAAFNCCLA